MAGTRHDAVCPICGKGFLERRRRRFWMRLIPGSKHYRCNWCPSRYLTVYDRAIRLLSQRR